MIVIINGSLGVGKTSVADAIHQRFAKSIHLDGDAIGDEHPFEIYDDARIDRLYRALTLLVDFYQKEGYSDFIINYVFESAQSLEDLLTLLRPLDEHIHCYWLTCSREEQTKRIRGRNRQELDWELQRFVDLQNIQAEAARQGFIGQQVDTSALSTEGVADLIWQDLLRLHQKESL